MTNQVNIKIIVRYCGGCNPRFDRVALTRKVAEDFPAVEIAYEPGFEDNYFTLVVCGCPVRCASQEDLRGKLGKRVISSADEYPALFEELNKLVKPTNK